MSKPQTRADRVTAHRQSGWALGLELRQLRAFVVLVDTGNLSATARSLGIAQSTMSEAIAALERAIGTRIVVRNRGERDVTITSAGKALLPHARNVLASLEDAHVAVAAVDREIRTRVEVIASESVSTYLLPAALGEVRKEWPKLRFAVTVGMCPTIEEGLAAARYDVGFMLRTASASVDGSRPEDCSPGQDGAIVLAELPLALFAASDHPLVSRKLSVPLQRDQLSPYTIFVSDARGYFFDLLRDYFTSDGVPSLRLESTGSVEAVKRSVLTEDFGIGVLPRYAVADELRAGRLSLVAIHPDLPRVHLEARSYRTRPPAHPAVAALLEAVRRHVRQPVPVQTKRARGSGSR